LPFKSMYRPPAKTDCFHISFYSIMQKFRQHNKIFARACIAGQNAVKYSLTKNRGSRRSSGTDNFPAGVPARSAEKRKTEL
jgi:hypothetical protein